MTSGLQLKAADVEATLQPLERASMLPPRAFTDAAVLDWELDAIFGGGWICAAHVYSVAEPGTFVMREVGDQSFFVIGSEEGPRAFHNVCRHRGSRLLSESEGQLKRLIRCPYHAWGYGFDGSLKAAPKTEGLENFDRACYGLSRLRTEVVGGLVLVDLGGRAPDIDAHVGDLLERLELYRVSELVRGDQRTYEVQANWKAIAENYNECLHCPGVHPELNALSDYASGEAFPGAGAWCGGSMTLNEGAQTMSRNGGKAQRPSIAGVPTSELTSVYYFVLFPNALISLHPDYVMLHTLWPREPGRTDLTCEWFFEQQTVERPGFDPCDAVDFWDQVNREDWHVCELAQKGMRSRGYSAGRYTTHEGDVHAFDSMVAERYLEALREPAGERAS